jgi:hypothetical protein
MHFILGKTEQPFEREILRAGLVVKNVPGHFLVLLQLVGFLLVDGVVQLLVLRWIKHRPFLIPRQPSLQTLCHFLAGKLFRHNSRFLLTLQLQKVFHLGVRFFLAHDHLGIDQFLQDAVYTIHLRAHLRQFLRLVLCLLLQ